MTTRDFTENHFDHTLEFFEHFDIGKTENAITLLREHCITNGIVFELIGRSVLASNEFDEDARAVFGKVECVASKRDLAPKVASALVQIAKPPPEQSPDICQPVSQCARARNCILRQSSSHKAPHPTMKLRFIADLPTRGR